MLNYERLDPSSLVGAITMPTATFSVLPNSISSNEIGPLQANRMDVPAARRKPAESWKHKALRNSAGFRLAARMDANSIALGLARGAFAVGMDPLPVRQAREFVGRRLPIYPYIRSNLSICNGLKGWTQMKNAQGRQIPGPANVVAQYMYLGWAVAISSMTIQFHSPTPCNRRRLQV